MDAQCKKVIWREWAQGTPMSLIARLIQKPPATVFSYLRYSGGIRPRPRQQRMSSLSGAEREEISRGLTAQQSLRAIARTLHRSPSTISREVHRNGGLARYRALDAAVMATKLARRPKPCLLATHPVLRGLVARKLSQEWSPQQIASWLKRAYAGEDHMRVSHETIYRTLFIQTRGLFRKELRQHLRTKRLFRHAKSHRPATRGSLMDGVSIRDRPAVVDDRAVPGHWEGDLLCGSRNSYIATVVERQTRFTVLVKLKGKDTKHVISALSRRGCAGTAECVLPRALPESKWPALRDQESLLADVPDAIQYRLPGGRIRQRLRDQQRQRHGDVHRSQYRGGTFLLLPHDSEQPLPVRTVQ